MHFSIGKCRDETCRDVSRLSDRTARHAHHDERDLHDTCSGVSPQRGLGWTCPSNFFSRSCSWDWCKSRAQKTKHVHAWCKHYCFFVVRHVGTNTAQHVKHVVRVVSWTSQVECWFISLSRGHRSDSVSTPILLYFDIPSITPCYSAGLTPEKVAVSASDWCTVWLSLTHDYRWINCWWWDKSQNSHSGVRPTPLPIHSTRQSTLYITISLPQLNHG